MGIFDFWKNRKLKLGLNGQILRLKLDFQEEIRDFKHFKELQSKKTKNINHKKFSIEN